MSKPSPSPSLPSYQLLPFRFERKDDCVLLTNEAGDFHFLDSASFGALVQTTLTPHSDVFHDLLGKQFLSDGDDALAIDLLAAKYRTRKRFLKDFTSLHMVVPTLGCNSRCIYCQASSRDSRDTGYSMSAVTADKIVGMIFRSRSPEVKIEFGGGNRITMIKD